MQYASRLILVAAIALFLAGFARAQEGGVDINWLRDAYGGPVNSWPAANIDDGASFTEFGPLVPRIKPSPEAALKIALGARLFEERHLSASGQISCQSCHNRELGFGDGLKTAFGHNRQRGTRNAPSLFTAAYMDVLFWDGRSPSLEDQAIFPIINPIEMAAKTDQVEEWINSQPDYRAEFDTAFGVSEITMDDITRAIASFERTIRPPTSKWDRALVRGTEMLADDELWGLHLFRTQARCANCHNGPLFSDQKFHNVGMSFYDRKLEDVGRYGVTKDPADVGRFRTPSLRGLSRTGPYMHNGILPSLRGLVNLYARGGGRDRTEQSETTDAPPPQKDPLLQRVSLTREERDALVAFLETL